MYDVTPLRKSVNRAHDSLQPPPQASDPSFWSMRSKGVRENPLASHQSRFEIFPTWKRDDVIKSGGDLLTSYTSRDVTEEHDYEHLVKKTCDESFGDEDTLILPPLARTENGTCFFSKHRTITSFNNRNSSQTPSLTTRCGRRPADWHLSVASHTVGR